MAPDPQQDYVFKVVEGRGIHFIRFWFTDVLGTLKSFAITPGELEDAFAEGIGFDGSAIDGFTGPDESDILAFPDPETFQLLPWRPSTDGVGRMFCNVYANDGKPFEGDPRHILKRVLRQAADMGYTFNVGPELEYYYFKSPDDLTPLDQGGYFDLTSTDSGSDLRRDTIFTLEKLGITVEYSHHENGPSQQEIDLRFSDALTMADNVMSYRLAVKQVARQHGLYASFMPKPLNGAPGSGMHVHQSLFTEEGKNAFFDPSDPLGYNLSEVAKHYIAGLIAYAPEYMLVTNQYVNSYKRLAGSEVSPRLTWARQNREAMLRIPAYKPGKEDACRIELRTPDPACNPYLAFAAMLAAGLKGIEDGLELPPEYKGKGDDSTGSAAPQLPTTLGEAIDCFEGSGLMREVLGDHVFNYLVRVKREEWNSYCSYVSPWEIGRHMATL
ncbi:MAG: glutamine synthetase family protein [Coriobacteriales bacterium]|nr:glutamine synthetase family protein [Coriobacteriales bacterium]